MCVLFSFLSVLSDGKNVVVVFILSTFLFR